MSTPPLSIGHRGAAKYVPENTLESFRLAFEKGAGMIEFDVRTSKDGVPVIIHDARLERTTNGGGFVSQKTWAELKSFDAGFHFDPEKNQSYPFRGKGFKIPSLEEVLTAFTEKGLAIEIKERSAELTKKVISLIRKHRAGSRCVAGSKHDIVSQTLRRDCPDIIRFYSQREIAGTYFDFRRNKNAAPDPFAVASMPLRSCGLSFDEKKWIDYLHAKKVRAFFWTINDPAVMSSLVSKKADGIISDDPSLLASVIRTLAES